MKKSELRKIIKEIILNMHEDVSGGSFCKCKDGKMFYCVYNDCAKCADRCADQSKPQNVTPQSRRGDGGGKLKTPKKGMGVGPTATLIPGCVEPDSSYNYDGSNPYVPMGEPTFNPNATADCVGNPLPAVVLDALATGDMQTVNYGNLMNLGVDMSCCIYLIGTDD
tara:strand:- start:422 stop:919 length:498 start_codon:yes stop_codon:yes gene_type:complete